MYAHPACLQKVQYPSRIAISILRLQVKAPRILVRGADLNCPFGPIAITSFPVSILRNLSPSLAFGAWSVLITASCARTSPCLPGKPLDGIPK